MVKSRKSVHSIMNHGGFGELVITRRGISLVVPKSFMNLDGSLKKAGIIAINKKFADLFKQANNNNIEERQVG